MTDFARRPIMLFIVTEDWAFLSHRVPMAQAASEMGFDVHVACRVSGSASQIGELGFTVHALRWMRRGPLHLSRDALLIIELVALIHRIRPDVCNLIAIKPIALALPASALLRIPTICTFIGMGSAIRGSNSRTAVERMLTATIRAGTAVARPQAVVQNPDDEHLVQQLFNIPRRRVHLVEGSGLDTSAITPTARPRTPHPVRFVFAGRLLRDKGVMELLDAFARAHARNQNTQLVVIGDTDQTNPSSITEADLAELRGGDGISYLGHLQQSAVLEELRSCDVAVLPSYGEGLPRFLLEAGALGLALIATDVPGCRSVAVDEETGIAVPPRRVRELELAILRLAEDHDFRRRSGEEAVQLVRSRFDSDVIKRGIKEVYRQALSSSGRTTRPRLSARHDRARQASGNREGVK